MSNDHLPPVFVETLSGYRDELDGLDAQLVSLLAKRFAVTEKVGELKAAHAADPADTGREQAQLQRLVALSNQHGLPAKVTLAVYETLFALVRESHRDIARAARVSQGH